MRIESAIIGMDSARSYSSKTEQKSGIMFTLLNTQGEVKETENETEKEQKVTGSMSDNLEDIQNRYQAMMAKTNRLGESNVRDTFFSLKHQCFQYLLRTIFGHYDGKHQMEVNMPNKGGVIEFSATATESFYYEETEQTSFSTTGIVKTADGREIEFNLSLEMSRNFSSYYEETYQQKIVSFCDPLVINLDGNIATLEDQKFYFDLDADGVDEYISKLGSSSGYLALDKNQDGIINNGSELFGTKSGDGFKDLTIYDEDGNGWIDENDSIWEQLKIWTNDENGENILYTLKEAGVGAICLQRVNTDFSHTDVNNEIKGAIRSTGIFLYENGNVGTVQHLDLAQ